MDDREWLATRVGVSLLGGQPPYDVGDARAGVVVEPTRISAARSAGVPVVCVVGWPTGRHHSVIKAAEARLAAETGADEVWLSVDAAQDANAVLADIIAVRQAVASPTRFAVIAGGSGGIGGGDTVAAAAERAGVDLVAMCDGRHDGVRLPRTALPISVCGVEPTVEVILAALDAGAGRVFTAGPVRL